MELAFHIIEGPDTGKQVPLQDGLTIGRSRCQLNLKDPKISSQHAKVIKNEENQWVIEDLGSSNKFKIGSEKLTQAILQPNQVIFIGKTALKVVEVAPQFNLMPTSINIGESIEGFSKKVLQTARYYESLAYFLERAKVAETVSQDAAFIQPFHVPIVIEFISGIQLGFRAVLGYGPRRAGAVSVDLPIFESSAPDICFELKPTMDGEVMFTTSYPKLVRLNDVPQAESVVKSGDLICIQNTQIRVTC